MTWMTPFAVSMSAVTTLAPFTMTVPSSSTVMSSDWPFTVSTCIPSLRSVDMTLPGTT